MKLALFLGCNIPASAFNYELSVRKIAEKFKVELIDIPEFGCCGEPVLSVDNFSSLVFAARNIAIAEKQNLDILNLCNGCFSSLSKTMKLLENDSLKNKVNDILKEINLEYMGKAKIYHFLQLMHDIIGPEQIKDNIKIKLDGIRISCHNGCHILRPSHTLNVDDPQYPLKMETLLTLTGVQIVAPIGGEQCCGSLLLPHDADSAHSMAVSSVEKKGNVDAIVVGCPSCFRQFDLGQFMAKRKFNKNMRTSVVFLSQILGLSFGLNSKELGFDSLHKIDTKEFLGKIKHE